MTDSIVQYRGALVAVGFLVALLAAQTPIVWALLAATGVGVVGQFLPDLIERYGWVTTGSALAGIVAFTAVTIYAAGNAFS